jgi:hypothetical protein
MTIGKMDNPLKSKDYRFDNRSAGSGTIVMVVHFSRMLSYWKVNGEPVAGRSV